MRYTATMARFALSIAACGALNDLSASCCSSKTYVAMQPFFTPASPERITQWYNRLEQLEENPFWFQIVPFYSQTTNGCQVASLFTPHGKPVVVAGEYESPANFNNFNIDFFASYLGVQTYPINVMPNLDQSLADGTGLINQTFQSNLIFSASQKVFGIGFDFVRKVNNEWWIEVAFPVLRVENRLAFKEQIVNKGGGNVPAGQYANMTQALQSDRLNFARIDGRKCDKWGVGDIELIAGLDIVSNDCCEWSGYAGLVVPTGNKANPRKLFTPVVGNGKHIGVFTGTHADVAVRSCESYNVSFTHDSSVRYLFSNNQYRTFDLRDLPWSRYEWAYPSPIALLDGGVDANVQSILPTLVPVANFTTLCAQVKPGFSFECSSAFAFDFCNWHAQLGLNVHAQQSERICITSKVAGSTAATTGAPYGTGPAIASIGDLVLDNSPQFVKNFYNYVNNNEAGQYSTASQSNRPWNPGIGAIFSSDNNFDGTVFGQYYAIRNQDLDTSSAAAPGFITESLYGALAYSSDTNCFFGELGGSYQFGKHECGVDRWTAWLKFGTSF